MAPTERQKTEFKFRVLLTLRELQQATSSIFQRLLLSIKRIIGYAVAAVNLKSWPSRFFLNLLQKDTKLRLRMDQAKLFFLPLEHFPIPEIFPPAAIEKVKEDGTAWVSLNFWKRQRRIFQKLFIVRTRGGVDSCSFELSKERERNLSGKLPLSNGFGMAFDSSFDDNRFHFCKFTFSQFHQQTFFANSGRPFSSFEG